MASKTDIGNRALSKLGQKRVSNVDTEDNKAAKVIRYMYDTVLNAVLCEYPWNFALARAQLAKDAEAPAWGFANQYTLPTDFLSLVEIKGNPDYRLESAATGGLRIVTDAGAPIYILYIKRVTNTGEFDPLFVEAFASRLAFEGCEEITQSNVKKQILGEEYKMNILSAYQNNAIQSHPQALQQSNWVLSREISFDDDIDYNAGA